MNLLIFVCLYTQELEKLKKENTELLRTIEANETQVVIYFQKQLNVFIFEKRLKLFRKPQVALVESILGCEIKVSEEVYLVRIS